MTGRQMGLDCWSGKDRGHSCRFLTVNSSTGLREGDSDITYMGSCSMKGGTVCSRDCENCSLWARRD